MKFLIVEDDDASRLLLVKYLSGYGECHTASNGEEALEAIRHSFNEGEPYDLVCLDIMMPGLDGHDTLREIRRIEREEYGSYDCNTKVIMISALNDIKTVLDLFNELCDAYIEKPIRKPELLKTMVKLDLIYKSK